MRRSDRTGGGRRAGAPAGPLRDRCQLRAAGLNGNRPMAGGGSHDAEYLLAGMLVLEEQQSASITLIESVVDGPNGGTAGSTRQAIDYMRRYKDKQFFLAQGDTRRRTARWTRRWFSRSMTTTILAAGGLPDDADEPAGFPQGSIRRAPWTCSSGGMPRRRRRSVGHDPGRIPHAPLFQTTTLARCWRS